MSDINLEPPQPVSVAGPWRLLWVAFAAQAGVSFVELGIPILAPFVKEDLRLSALGVGFIVTALNVGRLIGSVPAGQLSDRLGERLVLVGSGLGLAVFAAAGAAGSYGVLLVVLVAAGIFSGAATPAGSRLVLAAFPRERRGLPMGVRQAAIPLGALGAAIALPLAATAIGWRLTLAIGALIPLLGCLPALALRFPPVEPDGGATGLSALRTIAANRKILYAGLWAVAAVGGQYALLTYLALYLEQDLGVARTPAFALLALSTLTGFAGRLAWGWASDRFFGSLRRPVLVVISLSGVVSTAMLAVATPGLGVIVAGLGAALAGFCLIGWQGVWVTMVSELAPEGRSGTAVGYALLFTNAGIICWPPLLGLLADLTGSFRLSWAVLGAALLIALIPLAAIKRQNPMSDIGLSGKVR